MAITDYNNYKNLEVVSVSGTPTISRALCIKVTSGDGDETGTGEIAIDWSNVSSKGDIGVFDENSNLLDYHFESFDATNETAVIWVYRSWVQDGTVQAQLAYGDGPGDNSVVASTVFDKESNLQAGYLLNESSGDALDVTSNNNDGTVNGATQDVDGRVGPAYSFDGTDDYIHLPDIDIVTGQFAVASWIKTSDSSNQLSIVTKNDTTSNDEIRFELQSGNLIFHADGSTHLSGSSVADGNWHLVSVVRDSSNNIYLYIDAVQDVSGTFTTDRTTNQPLDIGGQSSGDIAYFSGIIDNVTIYTSGSLSSDEISALYAATKSTPDFFSQQAAESTATVSTDSATNVTGSSATLNGTLNNLEGNSSLDVYFEYGTDTSYGNTTATQTISSVPTSFNADISGLTSLETYHYRAVATDGTDTWTGNDVSFYTADLQDVDETQSEFQEGTLTDVEADAGDYLRLADTDVLSFDGEDDYTQIPGLGLSGAATIEFILIPKSMTDNDRPLSNIDSTKSATNSFGLKFSSGKLYIWSNNWYELTSALSLDTEYRISLVFDNLGSNANVTCYVDGQNPITATDTYNIYELGIASVLDYDGGTAGNYAEIEVSDFRVWSTNLSQTEIQNNLNKRLSGTETNLLAYYKLDEGTGDTAYDSAGSNDGTIDGACLPGYTEVLTTEGNKRIDEINIGDKIISYTNDGPVVQKVEQFHDQGVKQTYELRTGNRRIFATDNHPFLVAVHTGYGLKDTSYQNKVKTRTWELQWKRLDELEAGDAIVVYTGGCLPQDPIEISKSLCKMIGCYLGDGYIIHRKGDLEGIGFSLFEQQKRDKYEQLVSDEFGRNPSIYKDIVLYSKDVAYYFRDLGLDKKCLYKEIPNWAFSLSKEKKEAIIEGFLDSDGCQNKHGDWIFELANEQLTKDLRWLAIEAGYEVSNIRYRDRRDNYSNIEANRKLKGIESWTFSIYPNYSKNKGVHRINKSSIKERVHIDLPDGYKFQNISSIKKHSEEKVYDIGLKDVHNFVAEGVIVHNSWLSNEPLYFNNSSVDNNRTHQVDLSSLSTYDDSAIEWTETLNSQTITIETRLSLDGGSTWDSWQTCTSGSEIPNFSGSEDLSNALLECRQNLSTSDSTSTPELHTLNIAIVETTGVVTQFFMFAF